MARAVKNHVEVAASVGDLVEIKAGRRRATRGRIVRITDANLVLDTVDGYVPRAHFIRVNPASQMFVNPAEFFMLTRPSIPDAFELAAYDAQEPVEYSLINADNADAEAKAELAMQAEIASWKRLVL